MVLLALVVGSSARAQQASLGEQLLPNTTKGALLVTNVEHLNQQWDQTQLGQLLNQPVMEPFIKDMRRQMQERFARLRARLGLTLDDLRGVPSGELDIAVVQPAADKAAVVLLVDVRGHLPQARELLNKVAVNLTNQGGKKTPYSVGGVSLLLFDVPKSEDYPAGRIVYFLDEKDSLLGAADDVDVVKDILQRKMGQAAPNSSLGDVAAFRHVMARCGQHAGRTTPQIRWFVEPLGYSQAMRILTPEEKRNQDKNMVEVFRNQGFDGVQGVGGHIDLKTVYQGSPFEMLHRTAIFAPGPYRAAPDPRKSGKLDAEAPNPYKGVVPMKVFTLPNSRNFALPPFIPNQVAKCTMFNWNLLSAFDNCAPLIDELYGEGEIGIWQDILDGLEIDEDGPQISLRNELVAHLDPRVTMISEYLPQITTKSERLLFAVKIKPGNEAQVIAALKKWLRPSDPTIEIRKFQGLDIWETVEPKRSSGPAPVNVTLPRYTPNRKSAPSGRRRVGRNGRNKQDDAFLPHRSVTVFQGHLLIASHLDFLVDILRRAKTPDPLFDAMDFRLVSSKLAVVGAGDDCLRSFSRTDEEFRPTYELIKMGKMPEAETMFGRMLNGLFGVPKQGTVRKQEIDGKEMPNYQVVRRSLGPAGTYGRTERDGWFIVGFMLEK